MADGSSARLAVLIDADNTSPAAAAGLLAEVAKYGIAHVKRAYGDWAGTGLKGWREKLPGHSIVPVQQFAYAAGKNATDSAMIIEAMDLLYTARFDGFCIVSTDSDFTRLVQRIRESGLTVYGFGQRTAVKSFVAACDKFIYIENLTGAAATAARAKGPQPKAATVKTDAELAGLLRSAVEAVSDEDGWAHLSAAGGLIGKQRPDFDTRSYGYAKLSALVAATGLFDIKREHPHDGKPSVVLLRDKNHQP